MRACAVGSGAYRYGRRYGVCHGWRRSSSPVIHCGSASARCIIFFAGNTCIYTKIPWQRRSAWLNRTSIVSLLAEEDFMELSVSLWIAATIIGATVLIAGVVGVGFSAHRPVVARSTPCHVDLDVDHRCGAGWVAACGLRPGQSRLFPTRSCQSFPNHHSRFYPPCGGLWIVAGCSHISQRCYGSPAPLDHGRSGLSHSGRALFDPVCSANACRASLPYPPVFWRCACREHCPDRCLSPYCPAQMGATGCGAVEHCRPGRSGARADAWLSFGSEPL